MSLLTLLLLDHGLPLALALSDGEAVDLGLNFCPPFSHVVFNVKHEWVLPEVCIHHLPRSLKAHGRVQVRLQQGAIKRGKSDRGNGVWNAIWTINQNRKKQ